MITGIVGLDVSLTGTGMAKISSEHSEVKTWQIGTKADFGTRLERYHYSAGLISENVFENDVVLVEDYAFGIGGKKKKVSRLATMGEITGIVKYILWRKTGREPLLVTSGQWKKYLSGMGNLPKEDFKIRVFRKYGREFKTNDICVAFTLAELGWRILATQGLIGPNEGIPDPDRGLHEYEKKIISDLSEKHEHILQAIAN